MGFYVELYNYGGGFMDDGIINEKIVNVMNNCFLSESYLTILIKIEENLNDLEPYRELFITIIRGITDAFIILISKIYDKNSRGTNILYLLDFNKIRRLVDKERVDIEVIRKYVDTQKKILESEKITNLRENLVTWRNKFYAHTDMDFLNNEELLREQHKINIKDFQELISFAKRTSQYLYFLLNKVSIGSDIKYKCEVEFELLIRVLEDHKRIYESIVDQI